MERKFRTDYRGERFEEIGEHQLELNYSARRDFTTKLTTTFNYLKIPDGELLSWDCEPEEAGYDRFKEDKPKEPLPIRNRGGDQ